MLHDMLVGIECARYDFRCWSYTLAIAELDRRIIIKTIMGPDDEEQDFYAGVYRARDSVANFRIRVKIRTSAASIGASSASTSAPAPPGSSESVRSSVGSADAAFEGQRQPHDEWEDDLTVGWQEKVFSKSEFE